MSFSWCHHWNSITNCWKFSDTLPPLSLHSKDRKCFDSIPYIHAPLFILFVKKPFTCSAVLERVYTARYFRWFFNNKSAFHNLSIIYTLSIKEFYLRNCLVIARFNILLIDYGRQAYYCKIKAYKQLCRKIYKRLLKVSSQYFVLYSTFYFIHFAEGRYLHRVDMVKVEVQYG